jgi:hypothetical protein
MTTTVKSRPRAAAAPDMDGGDRVAQVFVVFGITGDADKVMTFNSLHRLEERGLLNRPVVGVATSANVRRLAGACRFGADLVSSGLSRDCRAHELERLSAQPQTETANA